MQALKATLSSTVVLSEQRIVTAQHGQASMHVRVRGSPFWQGVPKRRKARTQAEK